jgi:probable O-glycosylation ligase (exosortase A-associated)
MTMLTIASTGSRGGFLAMATVLVTMAWKTKWKVPAIAGLALVGLIGLALLPKEYKERLSTITSAQDQSAQGRLLSWKVAGEMIKAKPVLGIGFNNMYWQYQAYLARVHTPMGADKIPSRVAHNSYLQIWAESGSIAFGLFLYILIGTIQAMRRMGRAVRGTLDDWITPYANTIQVTLIGYMAGAMFLNRAHFDLMYQLVAVSAAMPVVLVAERERQAALKKRRLGPKLDHEVWVRHRDPFARLPSA